jgi:hypothetical protein
MRVRMYSRGPEVSLGREASRWCSTPWERTLRREPQAGRPRRVVVVLVNVALEESVIDTRDFYPKNVTLYGFQITNLVQRLGYAPWAILGSWRTSRPEGSSRSTWTGLLFGGSRRRPSLHGGAAQLGQDHDPPTRLTRRRGGYALSGRVPLIFIASWIARF